MAKITPLITAGDLASVKTTQAQRGAVPSAELIPMQFRMPAEFAQAYRMEAVRRGMKYNELLQECFAALLKGAK
jgi:hypothetical protein